MGNSEKEKIIQMIVRLISMEPTVSMRAGRKRSGKPTSLASIWTGAAVMRAARGRVGMVQRRRYRVEAARRPRMAAADAERRQPAAAPRSEERRGGKECVRTCRSWWSAYH